MSQYAGLLYLGRKHIYVTDIILGEGIGMVFQRPIAANCVNGCKLRNSVISDMDDAISQYFGRR
jgi:hypothetical protein